jgi:hypothetical protein
MTTFLEWLKDSTHKVHLVTQNYGSDAYFALPATGGASLSAPTLLGPGDMLSGLANAENSMTAAGTATISAWNRIKASGAITITLPSAASSSGLMIGIIIDQSSGNNLVTLQDAAGAYIDYDNVNGTQTGRTTRIMWANEVAILYSNGTYWHKINKGGSIPMSASLGVNANQTFAANALTTLNFNTNVFCDAPSGMQNTGTYKLIALRTGKYKIEVSVLANATNSNTAISLQLYVLKNGSANVAYNNENLTIASVSNSLLINRTLDLTTNDYLQIQALYTAGSYVTSFYYVDAGNFANWFTLTEVPIW